MPGPTDMNDLINDAPGDLLGEDVQDDEDTSVVDDNQEEDDLDDELNKPATGDQIEDSEEEDDEEDSEDDEEVTDEEDSEDEDSEEEDQEAEDDDDYVVNLDLDEKDDKGGDDDKPAANADAVEAEATWVLERMKPVKVTIINAKDEQEDVEVYGYGDLPQDFKGFPTKFIELQFQRAVQVNQDQARSLVQQYRNEQSQNATKEWQDRENRSIAQDLKALREEGIFPKFKGTPGSADWRKSQGSQVFDEVVSYMNEQNEQYAEAARNGASYYHISFRQAFNELYPGLKEAMARDTQARRGVARKLKSTQGTAATKTKTSRTPVLNMGELEGEFNNFIGANN